MRLTKRQLKKIIREEYTRLLTEEVSGEFLAEVVIEAMDGGVRTLANFVNWLRENYPEEVQGLSKREISKEASYFWKAEKKDRRPNPKMYRGAAHRRSFYDTPGWGRFD